MAVIGDKQGDYAAADEHYEAALRIRPKDPNLLSDLGYSYSIRGNTLKAEQTLKQALQIEPTHKGAMANLGAIYLQQNRYAEAMAIFRAGSSSDVEAQQYMASIARLYPSGGAPIQNGTVPGFSPGQTGPITASATRDTPEDLSKLSIEQVQELMARKRQEGIRQRTQADQQQLRNLHADDDMDFQARIASNSAGATGNYAGGPTTIGSQGQSGINASTSPYVNNNQANNIPYNGSGNQGQVMNIPLNAGTQGSTTNVPYNSNPPTNQAQLYADAMRTPQSSNDNRGGFQQLPQARPGNASIQQASGQQVPATDFNNYQRFNDQGNATQMATQLGMSAGPGGMFPIVPETGNNGTAPSAPANPNNPAASYNNRFGGEFQQAPAFQNAPNWAGNPNDQAAQAPTNRTDQIEGAPVIAPASPTQNWQQPTAGNLNWQSGGGNSLNWANDNAPGSGAAGTGIDSGVSLLRADQNSGQRTGTSERPQSATNSFSRSGNNDSSKPYSGVWPNKNSLPNRQPQDNSVFGQPTNSTTVWGNNSANNGVIVSPANQNNNPSGSLPQYPFAPNR